MTIFELIQELIKIKDANILVAGRVDGLVIPVYGIGSKDGFMLLNLLHKEPWANAEHKTKKLLESLNSCLKKDEIFPGAGNTKIYLELDEYNFDYSMTIKYYEANGIEYKDDRFVLVAGMEMIEMRQECPVDPYLLKMQGENPMDKFYFPFRPGVDGVDGVE